MRDERAVNGQCARVRLEGAGQDPDEGRFARTVLADDGMDLPRPQVQRHLPKRLNTRVSLGDRLRLQKGTGTVVWRARPVPT